MKKKLTESERKHNKKKNCEKHFHYISLYKYIKPSNSVLDIQVCHYRKKFQTSFLNRFSWSLIFACEFS